MERQAATHEQLPLVRLAELRAVTYGLFGLLFLYPDDERLAALSAAVARLRSGVDILAGFPFFSDLSRLIGAVSGLSEENARRLREEYMDLFRVNTSRSPCPLNESAYLGRDAADTGRIAGELERIYREQGAAVSASMGGDLPDHAGLELEFMSLVCREEADAWSASDDERAAACLARQQSFLDEHLARWLPRLAEHLNRAAGAASPFRRLADASRSFVIHDTDLVALLGESTA